MDASIAERLIEINREFYTRFGESFSATRRRLQPGVRRVLGMLQGEESILDLGCGNGELARALADRGHRGPYLGLDFSPPLLRDAESQPEGFSTNFMQADLTRPREIAELFLVNSNWDVVTAFAVLHHIPSIDLRLDILRVVHRLLKTDGMFVHSNWQFLSSESLRARIQPWEAVSLAESDVDAGDYLLDWRSGGHGLRYVHHYTEKELADYASATGFNVVDTFYSDGAGGRLGLYQVWMPA
jgi:2-polyprenyl-3-methyl-5-hydroxy-6-metoxy-1,4-benzoquinol methylase